MVQAAYKVAAENPEAIPDAVKAFGKNSALYKYVTAKYKKKKSEELEKVTQFLSKEPTPIVKDESISERTSLDLGSASKEVLPAASTPEIVHTKEVQAEQSNSLRSQIKQTPKQRKARRAAIDQLESNMQEKRSAQLQKEVMQEQLISRIQETRNKIQEQLSQLAREKEEIQRKLEDPQTGVELEKAIRQLNQQELSIQKLQEQFNQLNADLSQIDKDTFDIQPLESSIVELKEKLDQALIDGTQFRDNLREEQSNVRMEAIDQIESSMQEQWRSKITEEIKQEQLIKKITEAINAIEQELNKIPNGKEEIQGKLEEAKEADGSSTPKAPKTTGEALLKAISQIKQEEGIIQNLVEKLTQLQSQLLLIKKDTFDIQNLESNRLELGSKLKQVLSERQQFKLDLSQQRDLQAKKERLYQSLSEVKSLKQEEISELNKKIADCRTERELQSVSRDINLLKKLDDQLKQMTQGISKRSGGLFAEANSGQVKIERIENAYKKLSMEEKIQLAHLNESDINSKITTKDQSNIGQFLQEIYYNRGLSIREATSFKDFKGALQKLKEDHPVECDQSFIPMNGKS